MATVGLAVTAAVTTTSPVSALPPCPVEPLVAGEGASAAGLAAKAACPTIPRSTTTRRPTTTTTLPANTAHWLIDANVLTSLDVQEEGWLSNGDEFYLAQIGFRSTPGRPGSTSTWYQGGLTELSGLGDGSVRTIPDGMGRVRVPSVTSRGFTDILQGRNPEIVGSFSVAFESDLTPFSTIDGLMADVAAGARTEIAALIEPLTLADLADGPGMAQRLAATQARIKAETAPSTLDAIRLFVGSLGDPDDIIAFKANVFVAVDGTLADVVDAQLGMATADGGGIAGALRNRTYTHNFAGDGASYYVQYDVTH
jgi:hypothetical protein